MLAPTFARLIQSNDKQRLQKLVTRSTRLMLFASVVLSFVLFWTSPILLGIFGENFLQGRTAFNLILLGQLVHVFPGSVGVLLIMGNHTWHALFALVMSTIVNIALNVMLIPTYGMTGAALTTLVSYIVLNVILSIFVWQKLGIFPTIFGNPYKN